MPKSPISYVVDFTDKWLIEHLFERDQGTLLTDEEHAALTVVGKKEYAAYVKWVRSPKRMGRV